MKTPSAAGLPADLFPEWRKGQERVLRDLLLSRSRFDLLCLPQGAGKSAVYMAYAGIDSGRTAILTATRALQDQNLDSFGTMGLVDMRGRANYVCDIAPSQTAAEAICTTGVYCRLSKRGCGYFDRRREAGAGRLVQTNYRFWLHAEESGALGQFTTLILDEAHRAPDEISEFAAVEVNQMELKTRGLAYPPWTKDGQGRPGGWANRALFDLMAKAPEKDPTRRRKTMDLQRRLARLCRLSDSDWLGSKPQQWMWRWDLLNPGALAEELLFRGAEKVILTSASARRKTLELLGVDAGVKVTEQESSFPVRRRPIYYWPKAKVGQGMTQQEEARLYAAIDEVIMARLDRRGYIPSVSYDLAEKIYDRSRWKGRMILHRRGDDAAKVLERFFHSPASTVLVSPAFNTGTDFSYRQVEYIIIPKVPFPNRTSPLVLARTAIDKSYGLYVTMQTIVQTVGRGMRAADDQVEAVILDSNFGWVRHAHWDFAPKHFHNAVRTIGSGERLPDPPPSLEDQGIGEDGNDGDKSE